jgi:NADP-dependent 3-hydroxy acid dehydrogenase YdfG
MIYKEVIEKRLARKQEQLNDLEKNIISKVGLSNAVDKRKYIELKAVVQELENVLDIADSMFKNAETDIE